MAKCRGCGAEERFTLTTLDEKGNLAREECKQCRPDLFDGAKRVPSDNKIYSGPQAFPTQYKRDDNGIYHAKDEILQDTVDEWDKGPTQKNIDKKRASRRTTPLSDEEVKKAQQWGNECLKPAIQEAISTR